MKQTAQYFRQYRSTHQDKLNASARSRMAHYRGRTNRHKVAAGCMDCGYSDHPAALQFDHKPGTDKADSIGAMVSRGLRWETIESEMSKCEVVCANCHAIRTAARR